MKCNSFSPTQEKAVKFTTGQMLLLAGPGSGKTYVITNRIKHLVENLGIDPTEILVITFTKAAAKEMQHRFNNICSNNYPVHFGTFHALFYSILKDSISYKHYTLIKESEKNEYLLKIINLYEIDYDTSQDSILLLLSLISKFKNEDENEAIINEELVSKEIFLKIYREYKSFFSQFRKMDFDDMGLYCKNLLSTNEQVLNKWQSCFKYILIDEFQDINVLQYSIIRMLSAPEDNIFVVGDDDQSIYGFRGSRPDIIRQFLTHYPLAEKLILSINYRSNSDIVNSSLKVIEKNENRLTKEIVSYHENGNGLNLLECDNRIDKDNRLVELCISLMQENKLNNSAIILRNNADCSYVSELLMNKNIPFVLRERIINPYEHFVIKDLMAYLRFSQNHSLEDDLLRIINKPLRFIKRESIFGKNDLLRNMLNYYSYNKKMEILLMDFIESINSIQKMSPYLAIRYIRKVIGYDIYLKDNYGIQKSTNYLETADMLLNLSKNFASVGLLEKYIEGFSNELNNNRENKVNNEKKDGIYIITMHSSKGLEFDNVIIPDCTEGKIPVKQATTKEDIEEERRLFYVAMTRAKYNLYLMYINKKTGKDSPTRFIMPLFNPASD